MVARQAICEAVRVYHLWVDSRRRFPWTRLARIACGASDGTETKRDHIRERSREAILSGKLPVGTSYRSWGGPSHGTICAVCDRKILPRELEYEIEFEKNNGHVAPPMFHLHITCFQAWEYQRRLMR